MRKENSLVRLIIMGQVQGKRILGHAPTRCVDRLLKLTSQLTNLREPRHLIPSLSTREKVESPTAFAVKYI